MSERFLSAVALPKNIEDFRRMRTNRRFSYSVSSVNKSFSLADVAVFRLSFDLQFFAFSETLGSTNSFKRNSIRDLSCNRYWCLNALADPAIPNAASAIHAISKITTSLSGLSEWLIKPRPQKNAQTTVAIANHQLQMSGTFRLKSINSGIPRSRTEPLNNANFFCASVKVLSTDVTHFDAFFAWF